VQAESAGAGLPGRARGVESQARELLPRLSTVHRAEQARVLHAGVDGVGVRQRGLEVPDAGELPGVLGPVVPLVGAGDPVVLELTADRLPRRAAGGGALDHLSEPAAGLRSVEPVRVDRRALDVVDLPAREVGPADLPPVPLAVRRQDERSFARANQYPYPTHRLLL